MKIMARQVTPKNQDYYQHRYNEAAPNWDRTLARLGQNEMYHKMFVELQKRSWLHIHHDSYHVLDVGIGSGALSLGLLATTDHTVQITGMDISPVMLAQAKSNLNKLGIHPELRQENIEHTALVKPSHDLVISAHMLEHFDDPKLALRKMVSLLKPGGSLLVLVTKDSLFGQLIRFQWGIQPTTSHRLTQALADVGLIYISSIKLEPLHFWMHSSIAMIAVKSLD